MGTFYHRPFVWAKEEWQTSYGMPREKPEAPCSWAVHRGFLSLPRNNDECRHVQCFQVRSAGPIFLARVKPHRPIKRHVTKPVVCPRLRVRLHAPWLRSIVRHRASEERKQSYWSKEQKESWSILAGPVCLDSNESFRIQRCQTQREVLDVLRRGAGASTRELSGSLVGRKPDSLS